MAEFKNPKNSITKEKFRALLTDLMGVYAPKDDDYVILTRKEIFVVYFKNTEKYSLPDYICRNFDHKVGRGLLLVTLKDNVVELRDEYLAKEKELESKKLPKSTRASVPKLAKAMLEHNPKQSKGRALRKGKKLEVIAMGEGVGKSQFKTSNELAEESIDATPTDDNYVSQDDINDMFGGNDINDIMETLNS